MTRTLVINGGEDHRFDLRGRRRSRRTALLLTTAGMAAIAVPITPALASGDACESRLVTIVILGSCESEDKTPSTVIAQQQQQAVGGGGGGGAAASSSSSGSSGSSGSDDRRAQPGTATQPGTTTPTLIAGTTEARAVRRLKGLLRGVGMKTGPLNGSYDRATRRAVRRFQRKHNIPTDPRATLGDTTWRLLLKLNRRD